MPDRQPAIAEYALIGDTRTAALCSTEGSIDWLCIPRFDGEPLFGTLVGGPEAGSFTVAVDGVTEVRRHYRAGSAVLETTWRTEEGVVRLTDGMVVPGARSKGHLLVRRIETVEGRPPTVRVRFDPRLGFERAPASVERRGGALVFRWGKVSASLTSAPDVTVDGGGRAEFPLEGPLTLAVAVNRRPVPAEDAWLMLQMTDRWWRDWSGRCRFPGRLRGDVVRSVVTLGLLTHGPSGAPVAAPTTSLPTSPHRGFNWDYRFTWVRDAAIAVSAFTALGMPDEALATLGWLVRATRRTRPRVMALYTIDGDPAPPERALPDMAGYRGHRPVHVGNAAAEQDQLDVYGWVIDAAWQVAVASGVSLDRRTWRSLWAHADFLADHWREPDAGVWESRVAPDQHVHSKLLAWLGLDRAVRMSASRRTAPDRVRRWAAERDRVAAEVRERGFHPDIGSYTRTYGSSAPDAALLWLPALELEDPRSPRVEGTVEATRKELEVAAGLLRRYRPEAETEGPEGAFLPCSFWLVRALARMGRTEEAVDLFDHVSALANDVGLFAEQMDPRSGDQLGNFPLALTHASLVHAALAIRDAAG